MFRRAHSTSLLIGKYVLFFRKHSNHPRRQVLLYDGAKVIGEAWLEASEIRQFVEPILES